MKTFADFTSSRDNNFNLLRFIAAFFVIVSHSFPLSLGKGTVEPLESQFGLSLGSLGVLIFFIASGYLVTMSYYSRHDLAAFLVARGLRIFPAICICTLVSVFVWGPCLSTLKMIQYFKEPSVYAFLINNTVLLIKRSTSGSLPGVFMSNPLKEVFNGSLWTLPIELRMYVVVAALGIVGLLRRRWLTSIMLITSVFAIAIWCRNAEWKVLLWRPPVFFLAGILFFLNRDIFPTNGLIGLAMGIGAVLSYHSMFFPAVAGCFLVYAVFWLAYIPGGWIRGFNKCGDYSYGLYIYAYPVQQTLAAIHPHITPLTMMALAFPLTLGLAVISWHTVESPSLALKEKFARPGLLRQRRTDYPAERKEYQPAEDVGQLR